MISIKSYVYAFGKMCKKIMYFTCGLLFPSSQKRKLIKDIYGKVTELCVLKSHIAFVDDGVKFKQCNCLPNSFLNN